MTVTRYFSVVAMTLGFTGTIYFATVAATDAPPPEPFTPAAEILRVSNPGRLALRSQVALVIDERENVMLLSREADLPRPIASLTKLMTGLVVLESGEPLDAEIEITTDDLDRLKGSHSRLAFGTRLTRESLLRAALGASDNRAASALARHHPGGAAAFVAAMNARAAELGMTRTRFADASGLSPKNVSTANDLALLLAALPAQPHIAEYTTSGEFTLTDIASGHAIDFINTNRLVRNEHWEVLLGKTGYTADAGNCLVMRVKVAGRPLRVVLLNSWGTASKYGDAQRIRDWLLDGERRALQPARTAQL